METNFEGILNMISVAFLVVFSGILVAFLVVLELFWFPFSGKFGYFCSP